MGDIRIGGYNFGNSTLAWSYQPPPTNNFSLAGDIEFNTGMPFNIGSTYDLSTRSPPTSSGHALGLGEEQHQQQAPTSCHPMYTGQKTALAADDIAGIRSILQCQRPADAGLLRRRPLQLQLLPTAANLDSRDQLDRAHRPDAQPRHRHGPGQTEFTSAWTRRQRRAARS